MNPSLGLVRGRLAELRQRIWWLKLGQGICVAGGVFGLALLFAGLLALGPGPMASLVRLLLWVVLAGVIFFGWIYPLLKRPSDEELALRMEAAYPELQNALINAIQLGREQENPDPRFPFSAALLDQHLQAAARRVLPLALDRPAPLEGLKQRFLFLALTALVLAVSGAVSPEFPRRSFWALITPDFSFASGHSPSRLSRSAAPLTAGEFSLRYHYPAYTGRPAQVVEHSNGAIHALKGTQVELATEVLEEVREANLVLEPGGKVPLQVHNGHRLRGQLTVMGPGRYYLEALDREGHYHAESRPRQIVVEEDLYPEVTLEQPVAEVEVSVGDSVELIYRAADDFGLSAAFLVFRQGETEQRREIFRAETPMRERRARFAWWVAEDEIPPGETVVFFIEVEDNDNVSGPKAGRSQSMSLSVFSPRRRHEQMLRRQEELLEQMLEHLAAHLDEEISRRRSGAKYQLALAEKALLASGRSVPENLARLALDLENDLLTEELVRSTLRGMARTLDELWNQREANLARLPAGAETQLALRGQTVQELESDIIFFDQLIKKQRIDEVLAQSRDLYAAQAELFDLLERYQQSGDPALWEQIQRKMAEVQAAYQALLARMAQMPKEMPEEFYNAEALQHLPAQDFARQMAELQKALAAGDAAAALKLANQFLASLNNLMHAMEQGAGDYGDAISAEALRRLTAMQEELATLEQSQEKLIAQTEALERKALEREQMNGADALKRLVEKTRQMEQRLAGINEALIKLGPASPPAAAKPVNPLPDFYSQRLMLSNPLRALQNELPARQSELEAKELEKALEGFRRHGQTLDQIQPRLNEFIEQHRPAPREQSQSLPGQCRAVAELNREIIRELENRKQSLATRLSPGERARLPALAKDQLALQERTRALKDEVQSLSREMPNLPAEIEQNLDQGQAYMYDASGELSLEDPARALVPAREAKARLAEARRALEKAGQEMAQAMKPGGGMPLPLPFAAGGGRPGGTGGRVGRFNRDFELPPQNAYQVPRAFRQDILEAMKDGSPEEYQELNRDYYERLVR